MSMKLKSTSILFSAMMFALFNHAAQASERDDPWESHEDHCVSAGTLRSLVDNAYATPATDYAGVVAPSIPGISVAITSEKCGRFVYSKGVRNVLTGDTMHNDTPLLIGGATSLLTTALTLRLIDLGYFGSVDPNVVLNTPLNKLLTASQLKSLTVGNNVNKPMCVTSATAPNAPLAFYALRSGGELLNPVMCPDLSKVTLRELINGNSGLADFFSEQEDPNLHLTTAFQLGAPAVLLHWGVPASSFVQRPATINSGLDFLNISGLSMAPGAVIGGQAKTDFDKNGGFQLLGAILERVASDNLENLYSRFIVTPLELDPIFLPTSELPKGCDATGSHEKPDYCRRHAQEMNSLSHSYSFFVTDLFPDIKFNGHIMSDALNIVSGKYEYLTQYGGAVGAAATPRSMAVFMSKVLHGNFLSHASKSQIFLDLNASPSGSRIVRGTDPGAPLLQTALGFFQQKPFADSSVSRIGTGAADINANIGYGPASYGPNCAVFSYVEQGQKPVSGAVCTNRDIPMITSEPAPQAIADSLYQAIRNASH